MQAVLVPHIAPQLLSFLPRNDIGALLLASKRWNQALGRAAIVVGLLYSPDCTRSDDILRYMLTSIQRLNRLKEEDGRSSGGNASLPATIQVALSLTGNETEDRRRVMPEVIVARNWIEKEIENGCILVKEACMHPRLKACAEALVVLSYRELLPVMEYPGLAHVGQPSGSAANGPSLLLLTAAMLPFFSVDAQAIAAVLLLDKRLHEFIPYNAEGNFSLQPREQPTARLHYHKKALSIRSCLLRDSGSVSKPPNPFKPQYRLVVNALTRVLSRVYPDLQLHLLKLGLDLRTLVDSHLGSAVFGRHALSTPVNAWMLCIACVDGYSGLMWVCAALFGALRVKLVQCITIDAIHACFRDNGDAVLSNLTSLLASGNRFHPLWRLDMADALTSSCGLSPPTRMTSPPFHPVTVRAYHKLPIHSKTPSHRAADTTLQQLLAGNRDDNNDAFVSPSLSRSYASVRHEELSTDSRDFMSILAQLPNVDGSVDGQSKVSWPGGEEKEFVWTKPEGSSNKGSVTRKPRSESMLSVGSEVSASPSRPHPTSSKATPSRMFGIDPSNFDHSEGSMSRLLSETLRRYPHLDRLTSDLDDFEKATPSADSTPAALYDRLWNLDDVFSPVEPKSAPIQPIDVENALKVTAPLREAEFDVSRDDSMSVSSFSSVSSSVAWGQRQLVSKGAKAACRVAGISQTHEDDDTAAQLSAPPRPAGLPPPLPDDVILRTSSSARQAARAAFLRRGFNRKKYVLDQQVDAPPPPPHPPVGTPVVHVDSLRVKLDLSVLHGTLGNKLFPSPHASVVTPSGTDAAGAVGAQHPVIAVDICGDEGFVEGEQACDCSSRSEDEHADTEDEVVPVPPEPPKPKPPSVKLPASFQSVLVSSGLLQEDEYELEVTDKERELIDRKCAPNSAVTATHIHDSVSVHPDAPVPSVEVLPLPPSRRPPPKPLGTRVVSESEVANSLEGITVSAPIQTFPIPRAPVGSVAELQSHVHPISVSGSSETVCVDDAGSMAAGNAEGMVANPPLPLPSGRALAAILTSLAEAHQPIVDDTASVVSHATTPSVAPTISQLLGRAPSAVFDSQSQSSSRRRSITSLRKSPVITTRRITSVDDPFLHWPPPFSVSSFSYSDVDSFGNCVHEPSGFVYNVFADVYTAPAGFAASSAVLQFTYGSGNDAFEQWETTSQSVTAAPPVEIDPETGRMGSVPAIDGSDSSATDDEM